MKTWIKRISIGLAVLLAVVIAGLAVFVLTFDPNAYKDRLQAWVDQRYHRTLTIDGDIEATLFPRLGLMLQGVSLSEPDSTETFASMDSARMSVAIWPLLTRNVVVDHASFSGVKARVVRDKQGRLNFRDLLGGGAESGPANQPAATTTSQGGQPSTGQGVPGQSGTAGQRSPSAGQTQGVPAAGTGSGTGADAGAAGRPGAFYIDIAGLDIKDGEVQLQDEASGHALTISQLNAKTGRVRAGQPFDVSLSAHVQGESPLLNADIAGQAVMRLDVAAHRYEARKLDLKVTGQLPGANAKALTARGDLAYEDRTDAIDASGLEIVFEGDLADARGGTAVMEASLAAQRLRVDPSTGSIQAAKVAMRAKGTAPRGPFEFAADAPALDVTPTAASGGPLTARLRVSGDGGTDVRLGIEGIAGNSANLTAAQARLSADLKQGGRGWTITAASPLTLDIDKRSCALPSLNGEAAVAGPGLPNGSLRIPYTGALRADLARQSAELKLDGRLEGGKLALTADANGLGAKPSVRFALAADTLDLDNLMPASASPSSAPAAGKESKSAGKETEPAGSGQQGDATASGSASAGKTPSPAAAGKGAPPADEIDLSALVGPTAQGSIKVGRLVAHGLAAQNVSANVKLAQGKLDIAPLAATLYGGKLAGNVSLDAAHDNAIATRFTLDGVAVGPLLADVAKRSAVTGTGNVAANLTTFGKRALNMRDNLGGTMQLRLRDGAIKGFDAARALRELKQAILGGKQGASADVPADASRETVFSRMDADLALAAGVATIKRLDVASPVLRVSEGSPAVIDLPKGTVDVVANVKIADPPPAYADLRELRGVAVPVQVTGPYDALRYRVDWRAIAGDALSRALQRALGGKRSDTSRKDRIEEGIGKLLKGITGK
jgi:AsmA protein